MHSNGRSDFIDYRVANENKNKFYVIFIEKTPVNLQTKVF